MRLLLALFAFLALAVAPVDARAVDHCAEMAGMEHGEGAPDEMAADEGCCAAVSVALPAAHEVADAPLLRAVPRVAVLAEQAGIRGDVEIPPPRP